MFTGAFIFISESAASNNAKTEMSYGKERLKVIGVSGVEEGIAVARRIVEQDNCRILELCGGFGEEGARAVREAVGNKVVVGYVSYFPEDAELINDLIDELKVLNSSS